LRGFWFLVAGFWFLVSGCWFEMFEEFALRAFEEFRVSGFGFQVSGFGLLGAGCWFLGAGFWFQSYIVSELQGFRPLLNPPPHPPFGHLLLEKRRRESVFFLIWGGLED